MKRIHACGIGIAGLALLGALGCAKLSKDSSKVIANVGTEKITEKSFGELITAMVPEEGKAKEILTSEAMRSKRNEFLGQMAKAKALVLYGKAQGLENDPAVKLRMEQVAAQTYLQILMERRIAKVKPTDADLKAVYDELVNERKAQGQAEGVPPYEQVKAQMPMIYKQRQESKIFEQVMKEATQKMPVTYAEGYKPAEM